MAFLPLVMPLSLPTDRLLDAVQTYTDNAYSQPAIKAAFEGASYGLAFVDEGKTLLADARAKIREQDTELGEQKEATASRNALWKSLRATYRDDRDAARDAFGKDDAARTALSLGEVIPGSVVPWAEQASRFYAALVASPAYVAGMEGEAVEQPDLAEMQASVAELVRLASEQVRESGEASLASQRQREALTALDGWYGLARRRARRLLRGEPRLLEALGV